MNVLPFVLIMITAMALSLSLRLPSTLVSMNLSKAYQRQMQKVEYDELFSATNKIYKSNKVPSTNKKSDQKKEKGALPEKLNRKLNFTAAIKNLRGWESEVLRSLVTVFVADQEWYQQMVAQNPYIFEDVLESLQRNWPEKNPATIRNVAEIALEGELQQLFLKRLLDNALLNEYKESPILETKGKSKPIAIYLAERPLLQALFQNEKIVESVIQERKRIYYELKEVKGDFLPPTKQSASLELERLFSIYLTTAEGVSFGVSKTKPPG